MPLTRRKAAAKSEINQLVHSISEKIDRISISDQSKTVKAADAPRETLDQSKKELKPNDRDFAE